MFLCFMVFFVFVLLSLEYDLYSFFSQLFSVTLVSNVEWLIKKSSTFLQGSVSFPLTLKTL